MPRRSLLARRGATVGDAEALLRRATDAARRTSRRPGCCSALCCIEQDRHAEAIDCYQRASGRSSPTNACRMVRARRAHCAHDRRHATRASPPTSASIELHAGVAGIHMSYGHALEDRWATRPAALQAYRAAIALKPDFGEVYWSMANLKVFRFEDAEVAAMEQQLARDGPERERRRSTSGSRSARPYEDARRLRHAPGSTTTPAISGSAHAVAYDPVAIRGCGTSRSSSVFSREFFEQARRRRATRLPAPIFIVGLPRSGLDADRADPREPQPGRGHGRAADAGPDRRRPSADTGATSRNTREAVRDLRARDFRGLRPAVHRGDARIYRITGRPFFTDKLPNNFSHVGFAHLILPNAKIINARRHPFDSCLGSYKQLFGTGPGLHLRHDGARARTTASTTRSCSTGTQCCRARCSTCTTRKRSADLETQVRRILDHCGLPFEEACLRFHETDARGAGPRARSRSGSRSTRARSATWRRYEKAPRPVAGRARLTSSRSCPTAFATRALIAAGVQSKGQTSRPWMAFADVHRQVDGQHALVRRQVVDRDGGRRRAARHDGRPTARHSPRAKPWRAMPLWSSSRFCELRRSG